MKKAKEIILQEFERIKKQMERLITEALNSSSKDEEIYISNCKSLAINIRILLSDTKNCTSILKHLGLKDKVLFSPVFAYGNDSAFSTPNNLLGFYPFLNFELKNGKLYANQIYSHPKLNLFENFDKWWNEIILINGTPNRHKITRCDAILVIADKEGGAHFDGKYDEKYFDALDFKLKIIDGNKNEMTVLNDIFLELTLFIAQEVLFALNTIADYQEKSIVKNDKNGIILKREESEDKYAYAYALITRTQYKNNLIWGFNLYNKCRYSLLNVKVTENKYIIGNDIGSIVFFKNVENAIFRFALKKAGKYLLIDKFDDFFSNKCNSSYEEILKLLNVSNDNLFKAYLDKQDLNEIDVTDSIVQK